MSVQPVLDADNSCIDWWSVDLFVDADGQVAAVTLGLFGPWRRAGP
ncbi:MAG: hypothetical protein M3419_03390 [Actinomycetota bacterium]|nr:hypothetical protein [Actinomycetota bacterium]